MSEIRLTRKHGLPLKEAKTVAQKAADELAQKYELESQWEGDTLHFSRSGVDGHMHVTSTEIDLTVKLGLLLRPFKAAFEQNIATNLAKLLAAAESSAGRSGAARSSTARAGGPATGAKVARTAKSGKPSGKAPARKG